MSKNIMSEWPENYWSKKTPIDDPADAYIDAELQIYIWRRTNRRKTRSFEDSMCVSGDTEFVEMAALGIAERLQCKDNALAVEVQIMVKQIVCKSVCYGEWTLDSLHRKTPPEHIGGDSGWLDKQIA